MQRIAGMTVKAHGDCEAWYNGQRDELVEQVKAEMLRQRDAMAAEMERQREQMDKAIGAERDRADVQYRARCKLLGDRLDTVKKSTTRRRRPFAGLRRGLEVAWAMVWTLGNAAAGRVIAAGVKVGLWEVAEDGRER